MPILILTKSAVLCTGIVLIVEVEGSCSTKSFSNELEEFPYMIILKVADAVSQNALSFECRPLQRDEFNKRRRRRQRNPKEEKHSKFSRIYNKIKNSIFQEQKMVK